MKERVMSAAKHILKTLTDAGFRLTPVRRTLVGIIAHAKQPMERNAIEEKLAKSGLTPDRTTLYRELLFLEEEKIISKLTFGTEVRYELRSEEHHHHLYCTECGDITCFPLKNDLAVIESLIAAQANFQVESHLLEFFGKCEGCRN